MRIQSMRILSGDAEYEDAEHEDPKRIRRALFHV